MNKFVRGAFAGITAIAVVSASSITIGRSAYERQLARHVDGLFAARAQGVAPPVTEADMLGLPEPVRRWLRWSKVIGRPRPTSVRLKQEGHLCLGDKGWFPYTADEYYTLDPPGFVWTARIEMAPGVQVLGQDRYIDGKGHLEMRALGVVPVAADSGAEIDEGDLLRYLNEIMWFPAGALSPYIEWEPIDEYSARATMTWEGRHGSAVFVFDDMGRMTNMVTERFDRDDGKVVPWSTPINGYGEFDGVRLPIGGEARYTREEGTHSYIRLRVTAVEYDRPERF